MAAAYENRTKAELLELAAERDIEGRSSMTKAELAAALRGDTDETAIEIDTSPGFENPTPSARALEKVGPPPEPPSEDASVEELDAYREEVRAHGEAYQAEQRKHRWPAG